MVTNEQHALKSLIEARRVGSVSVWSPYTNHCVEPILRSFMRLLVNHNHNCNTITLNDHHEGPLNGPKIGTSQSRELPLN